LLTFVLAAAALLAAACYPDNPQSTFGVEGPVARQQAGLFKFIFWIAVGVFVVVEAAIIFFALRFRARRGGGLPDQTHGNTRLEVTWTIIPALVLLAIAIPTIKGIYDTSRPPVSAGEPLVLEAIGHQWWFEFRYPEEEVVTANELHIPTGRPVIMELRSQDVIHSFWVPKLAGKVDMIPNNDNRVWMQADKPGVYFGQCAEFCGIAHAKMRFRVIAHEPAEYAAWLRRMQTPPLAVTGDAAEGRTLFAANCSTCHTVDSYRAGGYAAEIAQQDSRWAAWRASPDPEGDSPSRIVSAPNLTHFGERTTLGAGLRELNLDNLVAWIKDPSAIKPGTRMQAHAVVYQTPDSKAGLTDAEIGKIASYLLSLKPGEGGAAEAPPAAGGPARGQELFITNGCSGCHSTGDNTVIGPGLKGVHTRAGERKPGTSADDYIKESLRAPAAFVVPGFAPVMPPFAGLSDTDIADLVEYLKTLR
jgi:cytochrome c oxidase subunit 2